MSLERPDTTDDAALERTPEELEALLGDLVVDRDDHLNAPGFVIRPDTVQETLSILKEQAGYDHLSVVSAQEYENRYESIYHLPEPHSSVTFRPVVAVTADTNVRLDGHRCGLAVGDALL